MSRLGFAAPSSVARRMLAMRPPVFVLTAALAILAAPTIIAFLAVWGSTVRVDWSQSVAPTTIPARGASPAFERHIVERSMAEVWREWHAGDATSPVHIIFMVATPLAIVLLLLIAFLLVPEIDAGGPFSRTYRNSIRIAVAAIFAIELLMIAHGSMVVPAIHADLRGSKVFDHGLGFIFPCMIMSSVIAWIAWVDRTARQARWPDANATPSPRCERCGYDLTHVPSNGLCPECGVEASYSLDRGAARPGAPFERDRGLAPWLATMASVLFHPASFYQKLNMSDGQQRARRFRHGLFIAIACGTWFWMLICGLLSLGTAPLEMLFVPTVVMLSVVLAGWGTHRLIASIAATTWIIQRDFPSPDWFRKIIAYETAYLLAFCAFDGAAVTFGIFWGSSSLWRFMLRPIFRTIFGGLAPEPMLMLTGNVALMLFWFLRYRLALRKTRWANY